MFSSYSMEDVNRAVDQLKKRWKKNWGVKLGGYAYYPNESFTYWTASDGSKIRTSLALLIFNYADNKEYFIDFISLPIDFIIESLVILKRVDQEGYESGKLKGDWC